MISGKQAQDLQTLERLRRHKFLPEFLRLVQRTLQGSRAPEGLMDGSGATSKGRAVAADFLKQLTELLS